MRLRVGQRSACARSSSACRRQARRAGRRAPGSTRCCIRLSRSSDSANGLTQRDSTSDSPGQAEQAVEVLGGDPQHAVRCSRSTRHRWPSTSARRGSARLAQPCRGGSVAVGGSSGARATERRRSAARHVVDLRPAARHPTGRAPPPACLAIRISRSWRRAAVDLRLPQRDAALLRGDEAVFHRVRNADAHVEADDAGRALQRVRGAHARLELIGGAGVALEREQPRGQCLRPASRLPRGTARASRRRRDPGRSRQAPLQAAEQRFVVEHADRVFAPWTEPPSNTSRSPWRPSRARPATPADGTGECRRLRRPGTPRAPARAGSPADAGMPRRRAVASAPASGSTPSTCPQRHADQQLAAHVRQAQHHAARPVRQRMDREVFATSVTHAVGSASHSAPMRKITTEWVSRSVTRFGCAKWLVHSARASAAHLAVEQLHGAAE